MDTKERKKGQNLLSEVIYKSDQLIRALQLGLNEFNASSNLSPEAFAAIIERFDEYGWAYTGSRGLSLNILGYHYLENKHPIDGTGIFTSPLFTTTTFHVFNPLTAFESGATDTEDYLNRNKALKYVDKRTKRISALRMRDYYQLILAKIFSYPQPDYGLLCVGDFLFLYYRSQDELTDKRSQNSRYKVFLQQSCVNACISWQDLLDRDVTSNDECHVAERALTVHQSIIK